MQLLTICSRMALFVFVILNFIYFTISFKLELLYIYIIYIYIYIYYTVHLYSAVHKISRTSILVTKYENPNLYVFSLVLNTSTDVVPFAPSGNEFNMLAPFTEKERSPSLIVLDGRGTCTDDRRLERRLLRLTQYSAMYVGFSAQL